jgi:Ser/Thr protein kinase RdoA (MazF antagonist)
LTPLPDDDRGQRGAHPSVPATVGGYARLGPQQVLAALDAAGLRGDGRILQLNSYENRVFQVMLEDGRAVVAKFYRPGRWSDAQILEEHDFALALAEAEVPVVPPMSLLAADAALQLQGAAATLATWRDDAPAEFTPGGGAAAGPDAPERACDASTFRFSVSERRAGREPELDDPAVLAQLGRFIGRLHAVGRQGRFEHRHHLAPADAARAAHSLLDAGIVTPAELPAWRAAAEAAAAAVADAFAAVELGGPLTTLRLHGDCHVGNVLWRAGSAEGDPGRPHIVDLDDAMQGPAVQDLWMLVSGDAPTMARQLDVLLRGYEDFSEFDDRERALIEPLRTWRMLRHSAWLAARWADPTFPIHFPWFGSAAYWSQQTTLLREQLSLMRPD